MEKLESFLGHCAICRVAAMEDNHTLEDCVQKNAFVNSKRGVRFPPESCCFLCCQPRAICSTRPCRFKDVLFPAIWSLYINRRASLRLFSLESRRVPI